VLRVLVAAALFALVSAFEVDISLSNAAVDPSVHGSKLDLTFSLKNTLTTPVTVLKWNTPFDDASLVLKANFLNIETNGHQALYTGILAKRDAVPEDFLTIYPGETVSTSIDVLKGYGFQAAGAWNIKLDTYLNWAVGFHTELDGLTADHIVSRSVSVDVKSHSTLPDFFTPAAPGLLGGASTINCDASQTSTISTADKNAQTMSSSARNNAKCGDGYYATWFGTCTTQNQQTVSGNQQKIFDGLANAAYLVDCKGSSCSASTYAYVYPSDAKRNIYVCGAFWNAGGNCKYDSQRGTLIHEMSHFSTVAGTSDIQYGTSGCKNLAQSKPADAIRNADSYEYFNEASQCGLA